MKMFDYHCSRCGCEFFMEEVYDSEMDAIVCPNCGAIKIEEKGDE